ncbi:prepilin peptidase [Aliiroseovarius sp. CAU 1755]
MSFLLHQAKTPFPIIGLHLTVYGVFWALLTPVSTGWPAPVFAALLIWISVSDFETFEIPDTASFLLLASGLLVAFQSGELWTATLAAVLWSGAFLAVALGFTALRGIEGLGLGDVKLMAGIGAWLGLLAPIYLVLAAAVSAIVVLLTVSAISGNKSANTTKTGIAFGPFLCLSAWAIWLSGGVA